MALTTVQVDLIDAASPINNQYNIGERISFRTFEMDHRTAVGATGSSYFASSTGDQMMPNAVYALSTKTVHRVASGITAGDRFMCWNVTTGTTSDVVFSTDGGITVHDTGDCIVAVEPQECIDAIAITSAKWVMINSSAAFKTAFASST
jgi:hypothetical protein